MAAKALIFAILLASAPHGAASACAHIAVTPGPPPTKAEIDAAAASFFATLPHIALVEVVRAAPVTVTVDRMDPANFGVVRVIATIKGEHRETLYVGHGISDCGGPYFQTVGERHFISLGPGVSPEPFGWEAIDALRTARRLGLGDWSKVE